MRQFKRIRKTQPRLILTLAILAVALLAGAVQLVRALTTVPVSTDIILDEGINYWLSPPLCSDITSAARLEAELQSQIGPDITLQVARHLLTRIMHEGEE